MWRLVLAVALLGCNLSDSVGLDGSSDPDGEDGADATDDASEAAADGDAIDAGPAEPGPLTFIMSRRQASAERLCDIDGDGDLDNALADLGEPGATLLATVLTAAMQDNLEQTIDPDRQVVHFPWVDDAREPSDPSTTVIVAKVQDLDEPPDTSDDFDGDEEYYLRGSHLDECAEPLYYDENVAIRELAFSGTISSFPVDVSGAPLYLRNVPVVGEFTRETGRLELQLTLCGAAAASDLAASSAPSETETELSLLEILLAGGEPLGVATVPGMTADLDLDGDGLERFELDDEHHLTRCIDGDDTVIEGADCALDARIGDGFSIVARGHGVPAVLAGLHPNWANEPEPKGPCDDPPAESLWAPWAPL